MASWNKQLSHDHNDADNGVYNYNDGEVISSTAAVTTDNNDHHENSNNTNNNNITVS